MNQEINQTSASQAPSVNQVQPVTVKSPPLQAAPTQAARRSRLPLIILILVSLILSAFGAGFYFLKIKAGPKPSWQGIKPGVSTREDVVKTLGQPINEIGLFQGNGLQYPSGLEVFPNTIVFDTDNKVSSILVQVSPEEEIKLSDWLKKYGQPEKEMYNAYLAESKTYLYPKKGIVFVGVKVSDQVLSYQYFPPMPLTEYLALWGQTLSEENPYTY